MYLSNIYNSGITRSSPMWGSTLPVAILRHLNDDDNCDDDNDDDYDDANWEADDVFVQYL